MQGEVSDSERIKVIDERVKCAVLHTDGTITSVVADFHGIQTIVGGYLECVDGHFGDDPVQMWVDEQGYRKGLAINENAMRLADVWPRWRGSVLMGTAVVTGAVWDEEEGMFLGDLTNDMYEQMCAIIMRTRGKGDATIARPEK